MNGFDETQTIPPRQYVWDVWTWDGATWSKAYFPLLDGPVTSPSGRQDAAAAALDGALVLFGGESLYSTTDAGYFMGDPHETWNIYVNVPPVPPGDDPVPQGNWWVNVMPSTSPSPRVGAAAATIGNHVLLFGGWSNGTALGDTWLWDGSNWTSLSIPGPSPRFHAAVAAVGNGVLLFGGDSGSGELGDTWLFDGSSWTQQNVLGPSPRAEAAAASFFGGTAVLFGGSQGSTFLDDTWTWSGGAWTQRLVAGPSPRSGAAATGP
jgi:hypothetical protein